MDLLVVYDVSTADRAGCRRLARVASLCERYGVRVQKSVFECRLPSAHVQRLVNELFEVIDHQRDSIYLYRFPGEVGNSRSTIGVGVHREPGDPWIL